MAGNNNFGVQVTLEMKDKIGDKLKNLEKQLNKNRKSQKDFNNENKLAEDQAHKTAKSIKEEADALNNLSKNQDKVTKSQSKLKQIFNSGAGQAVRMIGAGFGIKTLWDKMLAWDTYNRKIQGITHATDAEMSALNAKILSTSAQIGVGSSELQYTAFNLTRTWNHGTKKITDNLKEMALSAMATSSEISTIADVYLPLQQQFSDLTPNQTMNAVVFGGDRATMTMEQLREAISDSAIAAKNANQEINTMMSTLVVLGKSGIKGGEAGTAVRNIYLQMSNPAFRKNFKALGVDFDNINIKNRNFVDSLEILKRSIDKMKLRQGGSAVVDEQIIKIFGSRYSGMMLNLLNNLDDLKRQRSEFDTFLKEDMGSGIAKKQMQGVANGAARLKAVLEAMAIKFNTSIAPFIAAGLEGILSAVTFLEKSIQSIAEPLGTVGRTILGLVSGGGIGAMLGGIIGGAFGGIPGAKLGAKIGAGLGSFTGGQIGYEEGVKKEEQSLMNQKMLGKDIANNFDNSRDYFSNRLSKMNRMGGGMSTAAIPTIGSLSSQNSLTNIQLVVEDKAGVKTTIKSVDKSDKGSVQIKQRGTGDYLDF